MAEIFAVLERLNRDAGTTIVMVEHRVDELADRVSRVLMMDRGSIVFDGTPREHSRSGGPRIRRRMPRSPPAPGFRRPVNSPRA